MHTARSYITALTAPCPLDLELQFTSRREVLRVTRHVIPPAYTVRHLCMYYDSPPLVTGPAWPPSTILAHAPTSFLFCFVLHFLFCEALAIGQLLQLCKRCLFCRIPARGPDCGYCFFSCASSPQKSLILVSLHDEQEILHQPIFVHCSISCPYFGVNYHIRQQGVLVSPRRVKSGHAHRQVYHQRCITFAAVAKSSWIN